MVDRSLYEYNKGRLWWNRGGIQVSEGTCTTTPTVIAKSKNFTAITGNNETYPVSFMVVQDGSVFWQKIDSAVPITYNTTTQEVSVSWNGTYNYHDYVIMYS